MRFISCNVNNKQRILLTIQSGRLRDFTSSFFYFIELLTHDAIFRFCKCWKKFWEVWQDSPEALSHFSFSAFKFLILVFPIQPLFVHTSTLTYLHEVTELQMPYGCSYKIFTQIRYGGTPIYVYFKTNKSWFHRKAFS